MLTLTESDRRPSLFALLPARSGLDDPITRTRPLLTRTRPLLKDKSTTSSDRQKFSSAPLPRRGLAAHRELADPDARTALYRRDQGQNAVDRRGQRGRLASRGQPSR